MSEIDQVSLEVGKLTGQVQSLNLNMEHLIAWIKESNRRFEDLLTKHIDDDTKKFNDMDRRVGVVETFKVKIYAVCGVCTFILTFLYNYLFGNGAKPHGL